MVCEALHCVSVTLQRIWTRPENRKKRALQSTLLPPTPPPAPLSSLGKVSSKGMSVWPPCWGRVHGLVWSSVRHKGRTLCSVQSGGANECPCYPDGGGEACILVETSMSHGSELAHLPCSCFGSVLGNKTDLLVRRQVRVGGQASRVGSHLHL